MVKKAKRWCVWVKWPYNDREWHLLCTFENINYAHAAHWRAKRFVETHGGPEGQMIVASFVELKALPEGRKPKVAK